MDWVALQGVLLLMLACNETVTIIHKESDAIGGNYICTVVNGVSWYGKYGSVLSADGASPRAEYTVRIPARSMPQAIPQEGDLIVHGAVTDYCGKRSDLNAYEYFRAGFVGDNRRSAHLTHWVVKSA